MFGWYFCYFAFIGITTLRYDRRSGQMRRCKYLQVYAALQNLLALLFTVQKLLQDLQQAQEDYAAKGKFDFAACVLMGTTFLLLLVVPLTVAKRLCCDSQLLRVLHELNALPHAHSLAAPRSDLNFKCLLGMICYHNCAIAVYMTQLVWHIGWRAIGVACHQYVELNMMHAVTLLYVLLLRHICQRLQQLVVQLERMFARFGAREADAETLRALGGTYLRLVQLAQRLTGIYQQQLLCAVANLCVVNATSGYFFVRFRSTALLPEYVANWLMSVALYVVLFCYFHCFNSICEQACSTAPALRQALRRFSERPQLSAELQQACELLALQLQHVGVRVSLLGLFEVRRSITFRSVALILLYSVWLVQWDYENI